MVRSPIEIYDELSENFDDTNKFKEGLWTAQKECLMLYFNDLIERTKIGIKLPTGAGKTLIGLLVLKMWLEEGKVVAIITWTDTLADRIQQECDELGVNSVRICGIHRPDPDRDRKKLLYSDAEAIGIFTYAMYLWSDIEPADCLIIDDADLFIDQYSNNFKFTFSRYEFEDIYNESLNS